MKQEHFQYFCDKLAEKYSSLGLSGKYLSNDFGRLGIMKMLFFCVIASNETTGNKLIDNGIFDNFWALPNGPVESECYNWILSRGLNFENQLKKGGFNPSIDDTEISSKIDFGVEKIPSILFTKDSGELVELSHRYPSWVTAYGQALINNKRSYKMDNETLKLESIFLALI